MSVSCSWCNSLPLPSLSDGASRIAQTWTRWSRQGQSYACTCNQLPLCTDHQNQAALPQHAWQDQFLPHASGTWFFQQEMNCSDHGMPIDNLPIKGHDTGLGQPDTTFKYETTTAWDTVDARYCTQTRWATLSSCSCIVRLVHLWGHLPLQDPQQWGGRTWIQHPGGSTFETSVVLPVGQL